MVTVDRVCKVSLLESGGGESPSKYLGIRVAVAQ